MLSRFPVVSEHRSIPELRVGRVIELLSSRADWTLCSAVPSVALPSVAVGNSSATDQGALASLMSILKFQYHQEEAKKCKIKEENFQDEEVQSLTGKFRKPFLAYLEPADVSSDGHKQIFYTNQTVIPGSNGHSGNHNHLVQLVDWETEVSCVFRETLRGQ